MTDELVHKLQVQIAELRKDVLFAIDRIERLEATNQWILRLVLGAVIVAVLGLVLAQ